MGKAWDWFNKEFLNDVLVVKSYKDEKGERHTNIFLGKWERFIELYKIDAMCRLEREEQKRKMLEWQE